MQTQDYKSRTRNVRREARAHLMALRRARTAQRVHAKRDLQDREEPPLSDQELHQPAIAFVHRADDNATPTPPKEVPLTADQLESAAIQTAAVAELTDDNAADAKMRPPQPPEELDATLDDETDEPTVPTVAAEAVAAPPQDASQANLDPESTSVSTDPEDHTDLPGSEPDLSEGLAASDAFHETNAGQSPPPEPVLDPDLQPAADAPFEDTIPDNATMQDTGPDDLPVDTTTDDAPPLADPDPQVLSHPTSNLAELPGAGPGLIWMLNQVNVFTLEDLAQQDAITLSEKLGIVGQILDVNQWIILAQAKTATNTAEPAPSQ